MLKSVFVFNDKLQKQIDGMAMGSLLGPIFADIYFNHYEKKWLNNCPSNPNFTQDILIKLFLFSKTEPKLNFFMIASIYSIHLYPLLMK